MFLPRKAMAKMSSASWAEASFTSLVLISISQTCISSRHALEEGKITLDKCEIIVKSVPLSLSSLFQSPLSLVPSITHSLARFPITIPPPRLTSTSLIRYPADVEVLAFRFEIQQNTWQSRRVLVLRHPRPQVRILLRT